MSKIPSPNLWTKTLSNPPLEVILAWAEYKARLGAMTLLPPHELYAFAICADSYVAAAIPRMLETLARREVYGPPLFFGMEN